MALTLGPAESAPVCAGACAYIMKRCGEVYVDLPSDQRRLISISSTYEKIFMYYPILFLLCFASNGWRVK